MKPTFMEYSVRLYIAQKNGILKDEEWGRVLEAIRSISNNSSVKKQVGVSKPYLTAEDIVWLRRIGVGI